MGGRGGGKGKEPNFFYMGERRGNYEKKIIGRGSNGNNE